MSLNYLSTTNFSAYTGADVNSSVLASLVNRFNSIIDDELESLFTLTPDYTKKYYHTSSLSVVDIGAWQASGLEVYYGSDSQTDNESLLAESSDYRLLKIEEDTPTVTKPVNGILLYNVHLIKGRGYLKLTGTHGAYDGIPAKTGLDIMLYDCILQGVLAQTANVDSGGRGNIKSARIKNVQTDFTGKESGLSITDISSAISYGSHLIRQVKYIYSSSPDSANTQIIG